MADCLARLGRVEQAEALYRDLLGRSRRVLGDGHPETVRRLGRLTRLLRATGRADYSDALENELRVDAAR